MAQNQRFEIPQELRQLAEENVERARQLYLRFMEGVEQAMAVWSAPSSDMVTPGFSRVRERAAELAKQNAEAALNWRATSPTRKISRNSSRCSLITCNPKCGGTLSRLRNLGN